jgi:hypothetical protein
VSGRRSFASAGGGCMNQLYAAQIGGLDAYDGAPGFAAACPLDLEQAPMTDAARAALPNGSPTAPTDRLTLAATTGLGCRRWGLVREAQRAFEVADTLAAAVQDDMFDGTVAG